MKTSVFTALLLSILGACASQPSQPTPRLVLTNDQYLRLLELNIEASKAFSQQMMQLNRSNENLQNFINSDLSKW